MISRNLGAVLYELVTGIPPYYEDNISKMYENIRSADLIFPNYISKSCSDVIRVGFGWSMNIIKIIRNYWSVTLIKD